MIRNQYVNFTAAINDFHWMMKRVAQPTHRGKWQGIDVSRKPEMAAYELTHLTMKVPLAMSDLESYRTVIKPNLPWADNHFEERVCGYPLNPGMEWANWPWGKNAEKFLMPNGQFDHNYMERYWPRFAGVEKPTNLPGEYADLLEPETASMMGYRFPYGDLNDVVNELVDDPTTRQAILPVFFPEDTGLRPGRRKPCSLYYHFMLKDHRLSIEYSLRSCDLVRHFRDDIYLTVRLLLWVLNQCSLRDNVFWKRVVPGLFVMHIANLHCFTNDMIKLKGEGDADQSS